MERESVNTGPGSAWQARPLSSAQLCTILVGQEALRMRAERDGVWPLPPGDGSRAPAGRQSAASAPGCLGAQWAWGFPTGSVEPREAGESARPAERRQLQEMGSCPVPPPGALCVSGL